MTEAASRTHAHTPALARRGSLQLAYDEQLERNARILQLAEGRGIKPVIREFQGGRWWYVPMEFASLVGDMVVRLPA